MLLAELVETSRAVAETSKRLGKVELIAACLRRLSPDELAIGVAFLSGELRQRQLGAGYAALRDLPPSALTAELTVGEADGLLEEVARQAGPGAVTGRRRLLGQLLARATAEEQWFLARLVIGELRQGALTGVMVDAVARAAGVPPATVRRALMLRGDLGVIAELAVRDGEAGLRSVRLEIGRPLLPMLAQPAEGIEDAIARVGPAAVEWKLDGARIQVHRRDRDVAVFSRTLDDVTTRVPELVEAALSLPAREVVLDGEAIVLAADGRPRPFQVSASRFGRRVGVDESRQALPLTPFLFDVLHVDGSDLIDLPGRERIAALCAVVPAGLRVPQVLAPDLTAAEAFARGALERGHGGVVVKSLEAPYDAGRRGGSWLKVKPTHTLDLVVLAAEWGHGRRRGTLSNLHLGARDPAGGFVMLGKTFKGMTDAMLAWQTERLLELEVARDEWAVVVRPELVAEIAFDGVQASRR